jgi:hypothetical protein
MAIARRLPEIPVWRFVLPAKPKRQPLLPRQSATSACRFESLEEPSQILVILAHVAGADLRRSAALVQSSRYSRRSIRIVGIEMPQSRLVGWHALRALSRRDLCQRQCRAHLCLHVLFAPPRGTAPFLQAKRPRVYGRISWRSWRNRLVGSYYRDPKAELTL